MAIRRFGTNSAMRNSIWLLGNEVALAIWPALYSPRSRTSNTACGGFEAIKAAKSRHETLFAIVRSALNFLLSLTHSWFCFTNSFRKCKQLSGADKLSCGGTDAKLSTTLSRFIHPLRNAIRRVRRRGY